MKAKLCDELEDGRVLHGQWGSEWGELCGAFLIKSPHGHSIRILSSGTGPLAEGWEHVSASLSFRTPHWSEMCFVKDLFWNEDELVVQYHPPKAQYVNCHPYTLHLWKPVGVTIPLPPFAFVGPKS